MSKTSPTWVEMMRPYGFSVEDCVRLSNIYGPQVIVLPRKWRPMAVREVRSGEWFLPLCASRDWCGRRLAVVYYRKDASYLRGYRLVLSREK